MAGAALEISYAGRTLISEGFGFADKDGSRPWLPNVTLQRIGSVTKVLPAHLLYQAHAAGRVHVHDAVAQTVSGFRPLNPFGGGGNITWHQLASQLSGLERAGPVGCLANNCTNAEALSHVQRRFLKWPPGTHPAYSNWAFGLLGNLLAEETLGASSFSDAVTTRIVKPLGLRSIGVDYTGDVWDRLAVGYLSGGVVAPFTDLGYAAPAGSAFSTVADLTLYGQTFLAAYFGDNDAASRLQMTVPLVRKMLRSPAFWDDSQAAPSGFGTPWELASIKDFFVVSKGGNLPGYATAFSLVPALNVTVAMAINSDADDFRWIRAIQGTLLPALNSTLISLQNSPPADPGPRYRDVVGTYAQSVQAGLDVGIAVTMPLLPPPGFTSRPLVFTLSQNKQVITSGFLDYVAQSESPDQLLFRFSFPASLSPQSCFMQELVALQGSYVVFNATAGDRASAVSSYYYSGVTATRVPTAEGPAAAASEPVHNAVASKALLQRLSSAGAAE